MIEADCIDQKLEQNKQRPDEGQREFHMPQDDASRGVEQSISTVSDTENYRLVPLEGGATQEAAKYGKTEQSPGGNPQPSTQILNGKRRPSPSVTARVTPRAPKAPRRLQGEQREP